MLAAALLPACKTKPAEPAAAAGYVNPKTCAGCHPGIAKAYARSAMGRSFARASAETVKLTPQPFEHAASGGPFSIIARDGKFFQRWREAEKEIHYVVGSGRLVRTYIHRTPENKLVELPLSWYAQDGFGMSPGFDRPDHQGFRRAIQTDCFACHNAYPAAFQERRAEDPVYPADLPEGIDCQRCHGPGAAHVGQAGRGAIVNPARLSPARQLETCLQCHLETTSFPLPDALGNFGTAPFSFQPGKTLGDYRTFFDHAPRRGYDDKFEIVGAAYRLRQSPCFLRSEPGKLQCTTCHDPHGAEEVNVNTQCQTCHSSLTAKHPKLAADASCAACHMPKRRTEDVVHAVVTDHRIARPPANPAALVAARAERHVTAETAYRGEVTAYYPPDADAGMVAVAQVVQQSNVGPGIERLQALKLRTPEHDLVLAEALRTANRLPEAMPYFEKAAKDTAFIAARLAHGAALRQAGETARARQVLEETLKVAPDRPKGWYELGMAHVAASETEAALKAFTRALAIDADFIEALNARASLLVTRGDRAGAKAAIEAALLVDPRSTDALNNAGSLLLLEGKPAEASAEFEKAARAAPKHAGVRHNWALALARQRRFPEARAQAELAVKLDPRHAGAHQVLGALLAGEGRKAAAIQHYREALAIDADYGRALVGLAPLVDDRAEAARLIERASRHPDPAIRQQAAALAR